MGKESEDLTITIASFPYVLLLGLLFGTTLVVSRFSIGQYHPTNYVALRFLFASLGHITIYGFSRWRKWPKNLHLWRRAALLGIFGTAVPMTSIVSSMQYQSSGLTSVLLTVGPAITVVMAHFALPDESLSLRKILGVTLALGGAVLLAILGETGLPDASSASPIGYGLVFIAMFFASASSIYVRKYMMDFDSFDIASIRMIFAAITLFIATTLFFGFDLTHVNTQGYLALGYASLVGTFLGMILVIFIIQRFGVTTSAMTTYVIPIVASVVGAFLLGEQITRGMLTGMVLIVIGIGIINQKRAIMHVVP